MTEKQHTTFKHDEGLGDYLTELMKTIGLSKSEIIRLCVWEHAPKVVRGEDEHSQELKDLGEQLKGVKRLERMDELEVKSAERIKKEAETLPRIILYVHEMWNNDADRDEIVAFIEAHEGIAERADKSEELDMLKEYVEKDKFSKIKHDVGQPLKKLSRYRD